MELELKKEIPSYPEFDEWYLKVQLLMKKMYNMEEEDLPFEFFWKAFEGANMTPRQAVSAFTEQYL